MRALLALLLLAAPVASTAATAKNTKSTSSTAAKKPASSETSWRNWQPGLEEASRAKKPILVDVYTDWCGWCKRMDRDVYSRTDVQEYLAKNYVVIRLNAESAAAATYQGQSTTEKSLASGFRVTGYPTTVFLRPTGDHMVNVPGYVPADRFLRILRYLAEGHMDRGVSFEAFEKTAN
jgi:thioredoxin-related protein